MGAADFSCYSRRRLNPFQGTYQVLAGPLARALSVDGRQWHAQLLSERAVPRHLWGGIGTPTRERCYFSYGVWTRAAGMQRLPVDPSLDDPTGHPGLEGLLGALDAMPEPPFPAADTLDLWLLDARGHTPLVLIKSLLEGEASESTQAVPWSAAPLREHSFTSRHAPATGPGAAPGGACRQLEKQVAERAGRRPAWQWFRRRFDGGGEGLACTDCAPGLEGRTLASGDFPELMLEERWSDGGERGLVADYLSWQAPALLTLADLRRATRARLERAAARRAAVLYDWRHVIPEVVNPGVIRPALVEAVLRRSG